MIVPDEAYLNKLRRERRKVSHVPWAVVAIKKRYSHLNVPELKSVYVIKAIQVDISTVLPRLVKIRVTKAMFGAKKWIYVVVYKGNKRVVGWGFINIDNLHMESGHTYVYKRDCKQIIPKERLLSKVNGPSLYTKWDHVKSILKECTLSDAESLGKQYFKVLSSGQQADGRVLSLGWIWCTMALSRMMQTDKILDAGTVYKMFTRFATKRWSMMGNRINVLKKLGFNVTSFTRIGESELKIPQDTIESPGYHIKEFPVWKIRFENVSSLVMGRGCVLYRGYAYLGQAQIRKLIVTQYTTAMKTMLTTYPITAIIKRDVRIKYVLDQIQKTIQAKLDPGYTHRKGMKIPMTRCGGMGTIEDLPICMRRLHMATHRTHECRKVYVNMAKRIGVSWPRLRRKLRRDLDTKDNTKRYGTNGKKSVMVEMQQLYKKTHKFKYTCKSVRKLSVREKSVCPFKERAQCKTAMRLKQVPYSHVMVIHERVNNRFLAGKKTNSTRLYK